MVEQSGTKQETKHAFEGTFLVCASVLNLHSSLQMHMGLGHEFLQRGALGWCHEVFLRVLDGEELWMETLGLSTPRLRTTATSRTDPSGPVTRGRGRVPPPLSLCLCVPIYAPVAGGR